MDVVAFMQSRFQCVITICKYMSATDPRMVLREPTRDSIVAVVRQFEEIRDELLKDYINYVVPVTANVTLENSCGNIAIRFDFMQAWLLVNRVLEAYMLLLKRDDFPMKHAVVEEFFAKTLIPKTKSIYNSANRKYKFDTCARLMHDIYMSCFLQSVVSETGEKTVVTATTSVDVDPNQLVFLYTNAYLNDLIYVICELDSFPVLPPNICSDITVARTNEKDVALDILQPGLDSLFHSKRRNDLIACINCRIINTAIGHTDPVEQQYRMNCTCVYKSHFTQSHTHKPYKDLTFIERASMLTRALVLGGATKNVIGVGCHCNMDDCIHNRIMHDKFYTFSQALHTADIQ